MATGPETTSAAATSTTAVPLAGASAGTSPTTALVQNLLVTTGVRDALVRAYVAAHGYQEGWISSTRPGSVYYAYDSQSRSYLAWAAFEPSPGAPERVFVGMQDGGTMTAFRRQPQGSWHPYDIRTTPAFLAVVGGLPPVDRPC